MGAEQCTTTSATTVPARAEQEPIAAESCATAAADAGGWEFRLTADRRRILIPVNRTTAPMSP
jgi:hypothetical protein